MSNKKVIKKVFDDELDREKMKQQILFRYERKEKKKTNRIVKYAIVSICLIAIIFIGEFLNREKVIPEDDTIGTMKVYAYTISENEKIQKKELKDNVKLGLASYNLAMSSVPGYPILFKLNNIDYINIEVTNGIILDWDSSDGKVNSLGSTYQLSNNDTLYFSINENTNIKITGIKKKNEAFEKNIVISSDNDFNYYAILK